MSEKENIVDKKREELEKDTSTSNFESLFSAGKEPDLTWLDKVALEKVEVKKNKAKSYYLETEVVDGLRKLAKKANKSESQYVNDLLKDIVRHYLNKA